MKKSLLWIVVLVLSISMVAAFSFAGCKEEAAPVVEEPVAEEPAAEEPVAEAEEETKEPVTINFFNCYGPEEEPFLDALKEKVEAELPYVTLEFEQTIWTYDTFHAVLATRIATDTLPDLIDFKGQDIPQFASEGHLLELTGNAWLDNVPLSVREALMVGGKEYALPYTALYQGVFYNRDIFAEYNLDIPETWDELMEAATVLKDNGVTPFASHFRDNWHIGNMTMQFAMSEVFSKNPRWGYDLYEGKVTFEDSEEYRRVFLHAKDIYDYSFENPFSIEQAEAAKRFAEGKAAMYITGTWTVQIIEEVNPDLNYGIFPAPGNDPGAKLIFEPDHTWAASANTEHKEEVLKILEIVATDKDLAQLEVDLYKTNSLIIGVTPSKEYPLTKDIESYIDKDQLVDVTIGNVQIKWAYQEEYSRYISDWILGDKTLDGALKAATEYKANVSLEE